GRPGPRRGRRGQGRASGPPRGRPPPPRLERPNDPPPTQPRRRSPTQPRPAHDHPAATSARPHDEGILERRIAEGKNRREAIRCLKRQLARIVFNTLRASPDLT